VSQQYQSLEADDVPTELDRAILERAEQAVRKQPDAKQQRWRRWSIPVALAASTVLAVSIVLESNQIEGTSTRALTYPEPVSAPAESSAQPSAESEASPESAVAPLIAAASSDVDEERPRAGRLELERRASFQERPAPAFVPRRPLRRGRKRRSMLNCSRASKRQSSQNNRNVLRRIEMRAGGARRDVPRRPRERRCKLSERRQLRAIRHSRLTRRRARRHAIRKTGCETSASCALLARSTKRIESGRHFAKRSQTTKSPMTIQRLRANAESKRVVLSAGCGQLAPAIRGRNMRTVVP